VQKLSLPAAHPTSAPESADPYEIVNSRLATPEATGAFGSSAGPR